MKEVKERINKRQEEDKRRNKGTKKERGDGEGTRRRNEETEKGRGDEEGTRRRRIYEETEKE